MIKKLSLHTFGNEALAVLKRFPASMAALAGLTLSLIYFICADTFNGALTFFLSTAFVLNLLFGLMSEESESSKTQRRLLVAQIALNLLLAADCIVLNTPANPSAALVLGNAAAVTALLLGLAPLPFWKEADDRASWNFSHQLLQAISFGYVVGLIMCAGLSALYGGITTLFGLRWDSDILSLILTLTLVTLPLLLTLIRLPKGTAKRQTEVPESRFMLGAVRYLFLPLVGLYMAVLYAYLLRILMQMELPKGMVTYLVSSMMGGIIMLRIMLYPYLERPERSVERKTLRLMPLLALPLVGLMTTGILHRVAEYGITFPRLYVTLLNLWFYAVCLGLGLRRQGRVRWLPLSLAALLLLSSSHPLNFVEVARRVRASSARHLLQQHHSSGKTMDKEAFRSLLRRMPEAESHQLYADVEYLFEHHFETDSLLLQAHFGKERLWLYDYDVFMEEATELSFSKDNTSNPCIIPAGCREMVALQRYRVQFKPLGGGEFEARMPDHTPLRLHPSRIDFTQPETYTIRMGKSDTLFVIRDLHIPDTTETSSGQMEGYLFYP